jgi:hypothetical protein
MSENLLFPFSVLAAFSKIHVSAVISVIHYKPPLFKASGGGGGNMFTSSCTLVGAYHALSACN